MIVKRPKIRPWMLKKEILILFFGLRDSRTTLLAKLPAILSIIYLLSPIDLIPDFIPFFGYVDDIVIVPLLLNVAIKLLPDDVREESIVKANRHQFKFKLIITFQIIFVIALLVAMFFLIRRLISY
ncbi:MAG TPA: DUF1232 domain-containing protein [Puia sp.]|nr:DUF1232 domain-containing protein [Puia sp.]